jgi:hypothetical protein
LPGREKYAPYFPAAERRNRWSSVFLKIELIGLVVAVLRSEFGLDLVETECLELEPHQRPGGVLCEHLVDLDTDLLAGLEVPLDEVVVENLLGECLSHSS